MKSKLTILIVLLLHMAVITYSQPSKSFRLEEGRFRLIALCEKLKNEQQLNISFNHSEKALQKEVAVAKGTYTFEKLFSAYFRANGLEYKSLGSQIIIYAAKESGPSGKKSAENKITISGYVTDSASGERLQGATIAILNKGVGTTSNAYGFYSLTFPQGNTELVVNVVGFEPLIHSLELAGDTTITFNLAPAAATLSSVVVTATTNRKVPIQHSTQMSMVDLPIETIESMPKLFGETDVFRALQFLPGVQAGSEVSSGLYVRGGSPDQNLILLDGVPVYNASHLFGLFSVFNADAVQSVQLYKGGFPARYGGRLSSVVDIRMKEGNKHTWGGEGGIGLLASRFTLEGPLSKGRSSMMVSGRITNLGPLMRFLSTKGNDPGFEGKTVYGFYDLNLKSNFYLSSKDHLYISGYFGKDRLISEEEFNNDFGGNKNTSTYEFGLRWGNATAVARWNHQFNKKMFANTTVHFSRYQYSLFSDESYKWPANNEFSQYYQKHSSDLQDIALKYDLEIIPSPYHYIRTGIAATRHKFIPGVFENRSEENGVKTDTSISGGQSISGEYDMYIEDDMQLTSRLKGNLGLHGTGFSVGNRFYTSLQPRMSLRYLLNDKLSMKASFVYMNQFIHLLSNSGIGLPTDLWVPVTENIPPQKSLQYTIGAAYTSPKNIEFSVEGYYKDMRHVLEYEEGASFTNTTVNWEQRVAMGNGKSRGLELMMQKKKGKTTGLLGYTISKSDRTFPTINEGRTSPYRYDRRHDLKFLVNHKFSKKFELSFDWVFGTGQAMTVPLQTYVDGNGEQITTYSDRNSFRMPVYHRGDISLSFHKQKKRWQRSWTVGVYNVYGRQNPLYVTLNSHDINNATGLRQTSFLAFPVPSISYQFKF